MPNKSVVTILSFQYKEIQKQNVQKTTNYRSFCELDFDCFVTNDAESTRNIQNASAILAAGYPGLSRLTKAWMKPKMSHTRNPKQIWVMRQHEASSHIVDLWPLLAGHPLGSLFNWTIGSSDK